ncbi:MAG: CBS domain-containing protein [Alphaproteobacteria bacterium]|nr:inosine-5-monophosphate dehydrogenase [Rhodobiaceae bacterium]MBO6543341.1 CBS domain-containing protein [Alphaproteobacteria bacterium]MBO6629494.1 CBS domain-containing protein [Alphaproteobacteria bacterium]MDF1627232.1 CBS domain-containing protein [Parvibaculaceae bacterium]|tara:strand:+ start:1010 stop:1438 length:429 start_codon:yes stop_codon:yes gene_type:complete
MNVEAILKGKGDDVTTVDTSTKLARAAHLLTEKKIGALVVMDGDRVRGIVSERDIVRTLSVAGAEALDMEIGQVMTQNVITCTREDTLDQLMSLMTGRRFRHLPVVEDDKLIGIVSIGDVVKHRLAETEMEAEQLRLYIATG